MAKKNTRNVKTKSKKSSRKIVKPTNTPNKKSLGKLPAKILADKGLPATSVPSPDRTAPPQLIDDSRVFTIEIDSIRAETTIGDLIVAFPRTRDVLMKHGLTFDVEQAGYLYMTLNVFSAIHGLALTGFLQELDIASKEMPLPPLAAPPVRQIASPPTT